MNDEYNDFYAREYTQKPNDYDNDNDNVDYSREQHERYIRWETQMTEVLRVVPSIADRLYSRLYNATEQKWVNINVHRTRKLLNKMLNTMTAQEAMDMLFLYDDEWQEYKAKKSL